MAVWESWDGRIAQTATGLRKRGKAELDQHWKKTGAVWVRYAAVASGVVGGGKSICRTWLHITTSALSQLLDTKHSYEETLGIENIL